MRENSFFRYARYYVKTTLLRGAVLAALCYLITNVSISVSSHTVGQEKVIYLNIGILTFLLGALATVLPVLELSGFKNRRNLDTLLSLPVSRTKMAAVHYANGALQLVLCFALCLPEVLALMTFPEDTIDLYVGYFWPYCGLALVAALSIYSIFCFLFMQAETAGDGVVMMLVYSLLGMAVLGALGEAFSLPWLSTIAVDYGVLYWPLSLPRTVFHDAICYGAQPRLTTEKAIALTVWIVLGVAAAVGYFITFARHRAERVGGLTHSFFGYRVLIPLIAYSTLLVAGGYSFIDLAITVVLMVVAYMIYRRSPRLRRADLLFIAGTLPVFVLAVLLS